MKKFFLFLFLFALPFIAYGETYFFSFSGHLGEDELSDIDDEIFAIKEKENATIIIQVYSTSGDLSEVIRLSQDLHELQIKNKAKIIIYIQERAIGPAAVLPFLADELLITPRVTWGDIFYEQDQTVGRNLIRNLVKKLVPSDHQHRSDLEEMADSMIDPNHQFAHEKPLLIDAEQIESLGLASKVLTETDFFEKYLPQVDPKFKKSDARVIATKNHLNEKMKKYLSYNLDSENLIGYIYIGKDRGIDQSTYIYIKFALAEYKKRGARFVILHLNTPGGEVLSSLKIAELLQKSDVNNHMPIIAFIDNWAVSAGAMLAYSSRFIGIVKSSIMGAAEPVTIGQEGKMESAPEKVNSALRAEFSNLASFYGRNPLLAQAMVDKDMILVRRKHKILQLQNESEIEASDLIISKKGKLLTLDAKQLMNLEVADFQVPIKMLPSITEEEKSKGTWPADKELVFQQNYLKHIPNAVILSYKDWRVTFFSILSNPIVSSLLFMGLVIGLYIEISTPGFGLPGSIATACLALILLSSFSIQAINWIEVIVLIAGIILLLIELFVIPGFGVIGILGIILTVIGLFALMIPGLEKVNFFNVESIKLAATSILQRLAFLSGALVLSVIIIALLAKFFSHRFYTLSKLVLKSEDTADKSLISELPKEAMPRLGTRGITYTPLRPSGKVHIDDHIFDAMTEGGFIDKEVPIEVVRVEGSRIIVKIIKLK